jgi:cytochrome c oxidase subunit II
MPSSIQSALHPAGLQAARIETLWWIMFWVCTGVFVLVMMALAVAVARGRAGRSTATTSGTLARGVGAAVGVSVVLLIGLLFASVMTGRAVGSMQSSGALGLVITGNQWWWHVEYLNADPSMRVTTANEIHLPVGRPVAVTLRSQDVIHSFWVPPLHGKTDLIPGRENTTWLTADRPGVYRGQCAEYCGAQHAHMALVVIAESPESFDRWLAAQRAPAGAGRTPEQARGSEVFAQRSCAMCHTIRGTTAGARLGPDLTHFATRSTIAAGTMPNTPVDLARWITDPQHLKPGARMPATGLSTADMQALVAYLEILR